MTWLLDLIRGLLSIFDRMIYALIELFYTTFLNISKIRLFTPDVIDQLTDRLYGFICIIMIFKLSFSIIKYIINPDTFSNQEKGMGKIIQNIIIMLVLLVSIPEIFNKAFQLQEIVINKNIIPKIVLGSVKDSNGNAMDDDLFNERIYKSISYTTLSAFLKPNPKFTTKDSSDPLGYKCVGSTGSFQECLNKLSNNVSLSYGDEAVKTGYIYAYAYQNDDYQSLINLITTKCDNPGVVGGKCNKDDYVFEYTYLISTIAGAFVAVIFLTFCFDVAVRAVKLSFLQLIAPIPIISYIDPKSSKNGMFQKWMKASLNTYLDLFIRLIAIYFAIYVIAQIFEPGQIYDVTTCRVEDGKTVCDSANGFLKVFIMLGALMFAKQAPKLIQEISGINLSGDFTLNPISKVKSIPVVGKAITGTAKAGLAVAGGVVGAGAGLIGGGLATGGAALGSLAQGAWGAARGNGWSFNKDRVANAWRNTGHREARNAINMLNRSGQSMASIVGAKYKDIHVPYSGDEDKAYNEAVKAMRQKEKAMKIFKDNTHNKTPDYDKLYNNENFRNAVERRDITKQQMVDANNYLSSLQTRLQQGDSTVTADMINDASKAAKDATDNYNLADSTVNDMGKIYKSDFKTYQLYKRGKDLSSLNSAVTSTSSASNNQSSSQQTSSAPSYNATVTAQQQAANTNGGYAATSNSSASSNQAGSQQTSSAPSYNASSNTQQQTGGQMPSVQPPSRSGGGNQTGGQMPSV